MSDTTEADASPSSESPSTDTEKGQSFADLGLDERIVSALEGLGFETPTPIQAQCIGPLLEGRDLLGRARTGSGKTAAFGLPLLQKLTRGTPGPVRGLVLAPTRELALQISAAIESYGSGLRLRVVTLYGGASYRPQLSALERGVDIVVGTPGRLLDHLRRGSLDLENVELAVLDEADEMLRMGFIDDVTELLGAIGERPQVALFSATMPPQIREVAETYLDHPLEIQVEERQLTVDHITQLRIDVPDRRELDTLCRLLAAKRPGATLIFARTRASCDELAKALAQRGLSARALHGDMSQAAREEVLEGLRAQHVNMVVATDVASRGIDVEHLTHVINVDLPEEPEVYVNRIGRTGRAGREGVAISLVKRREQRLLRRIEIALKRRIETIPIPSDAEIVRRQQSALEADLRAALETPRAHDAGALRQSLLAAAAQEHETEDGGELGAEAGDGPDTGDGAEGPEPWSDASLLQAALTLLLQDRGLQIRANPSEEPPVWARRSGRRPKSSSMAPRGPRPRRDASDRAAADQATLSAGIGRVHGVGPNDIVGVLANELGVEVKDIGRIRISDQRLTVAMTEAAAKRLSDSPQTVFLRGQRVVFTRPGGGPPPAAATAGVRRGPAPAQGARQGPGPRTPSPGPRPSSPGPRVKRGKPGPRPGQDTPAGGATKRPKSKGKGKNKGFGKRKGWPGAKGR